MWASFFSPSSCSRCSFLSPSSSSFSSSSRPFLSSSHFYLPLSLIPPPPPPPPPPHLHLLNYHSTAPNPPYLLPSHRPRFPYALLLSSSSSSCTISTKAATHVNNHITHPNAREQEPSPHSPVLLNEVLAQFADRHVTSFVDCTIGAGGHASAMIEAHRELQSLIGFDVDQQSHSGAKLRIQRALERMDRSSSPVEKLQVHLLHTNFKYIRKALKQVDNHLALIGVDGILMDLGISSMQIDSPERGFSFQRDGPVDMRMDTSQILKAEDILNNWPEDEIGRVLRDYGEERRWKYIAGKILDARLSGGIGSTSRLVEVIGGRMQNFGKGHMRKHPATRTFQALRIAVNDELKSLETAIVDAVACLAPKGRLAVISFHSLEDRIVKHSFLKFANSKEFNDV